MISQDDYRKQRAGEIEAKLDAVEEVRPGDWITTLGSGHNQCTAVTAELVERGLDREGNKVERPSACPYRNEVKACKHDPILRHHITCEVDEVFPRDCPLEPTNVNAWIVCDCLPDYVIEDAEAVGGSPPDHVPLLKFFETIKVDIRFLLDETRRLTALAEELKAEAARSEDLRSELENLVEEIGKESDAPSNYLALAIINAEGLLEKTATKYPPYGDCKSSLGCRCVITDGKSKAVSDAQTCEACARRAQAQE